MRFLSFQHFLKVCFSIFTFQLCDIEWIYFYSLLKFHLCIYLFSVFVRPRWYRFGYQRTTSELFLSFHDVGPELQIQVVHLSGKCLYLLSNPTSLRHNLIHFSVKNLRFWIRQVS